MFQSLRISLKWVKTTNKDVAPENSDFFYLKNNPWYSEIRIYKCYPIFGNSWLVSGVYRSEINREPQQKDWTGLLMQRADMSLVNHPLDVPSPTNTALRKGFINHWFPFNKAGYSTLISDGGYFSRGLVGWLANYMV